MQTNDCYLLRQIGKEDFYYEPKYVKGLSYFWNRTLIAKLSFEHKCCINRLAK